MRNCSEILSSPIAYCEAIQIYVNHVSFPSGEVVTKKLEKLGDTRVDFKSHLPVVLFIK